MEDNAPILADAANAERQPLPDGSVKLRAISC